MALHWVWRIFIFTAILNLSSHAQQPADLETCFQAALRRSETLASQIELVVQAEERLSQARGGLFPSINGIASYTRLPPPPGQSSPFTRPDRPEARINATQPIFRGFREYAGIASRSLDASAAREAKTNAALTLFEDVSRAFYSVLTFEKEIAELTRQIELNQKRVNELKARRRIGRSRFSEVLTVEASVANLQAQLALTQGNLATARETLVFLTGFDREISLVDREPARSTLPPVDKLLSRIEMRPDVRQAKFNKESTEKQITIARGGHLPSIDIGANYYLKRVGILENQKWDAQATLTLPLFAGFTIQSQLREAVSRDTQAELELSRLKRLAEQQIRQLYKVTKSDFDQLEAFAKATELAERNYEEQTREYRLGLVNNLEVLQALNTFQESRRALARASFAAKLDFIRLETAAALRPKAIIATQENP